MESDFHRRALDGFDEALAVDPAERDGWAARRFGEDEPLRRAVFDLLAAQDRATLMPTEPAVAPPDLTEAPPLPGRIANYRPLSVIGEGGMGRVFKAERADGHFEQSVAIKILAARLFSGSATEQFRIERQILAKLQHPNIARLLDGGVTEDGLSYIVMELIDGERITDHADRLQLDAPARLRLLQQVCGAAQYAHQQLVVHADIKPGNILVDRAGCPKLLDFGIGARIGDDPEATASTAAGRTTSWSSPQLVDGQRPTPSDDIFALGLLLDTLAPHEAKTEIDLRAIRDCATALDPADRYASADALSADISRWLERLPVAARRPGRTHRARLFWHRNRLSIILAAAVASGLLIALVTISILYVRAEAARRLTQQRFEEVRALSRFMLSDVTDALEQSPGTSGLRRMLALRGRTYLEQLSHIPGAPIDLRVETAEGYIKTGKVLAGNGDANVGDPIAGRAALRRADHDLTELVRLLPGRLDVRLDLAHALIAESAVTSVSFNDDKLATAYVDRADRVLNDGARLAPGSSEIGWTRWELRNARANILDQQGDFAAMKALLTIALQEGRALPSGPHRPADRALAEGASLSLLGDADYYLGDRRTALAMYEQAVDAIEHERQHSIDAKLFDRSAYYRFDVASTLTEMGKPAEALSWIQKGVEIANALAQFDDSSRTRHIDNIVTMQLAQTLGDLHRYPEAIAMMLADVRARERLAASEPDNYQMRRAVPVGLKPLVNLYFDAGQIKQGCDTLAETKRLWAQLAANSAMGGFDHSQEMADLAVLSKRCASR